MGKAQSRSARQTSQASLVRNHREIVWNSAHFLLATENPEPKGRKTCCSYSWRVFLPFYYLFVCFVWVVYGFDKSHRELLRYIYRFVSLVTQNPVKLIMKVKHHSHSCCSLFMCHRPVLTGS